MVAGLNYGRRSVDGQSQKATGVDMGLQYNMSKRTYVAAHYNKETASAVAGAAQATNNRFRVQLSHAF
jgi:predicted porin